jgi:tRNA dimethylallyltransferase
MADYLSILNKTVNLIVILGPTASGKTKIAVWLATELGSEIISADSRQVYKGLDIGTGKDINEYHLNGMVVPYHLINVADPLQEFNLFEYQRLFNKTYKDICARGIVPIMVGGTGLYIESIIMNYRLPEVPENLALRIELKNMDMDLLVERLLSINPSVHNTTDLQDRHRLIRAIEIAEYAKNAAPIEDATSVLPIIKPLVFGIRWERRILRKRITERLQNRLDEGMIDEVKGLHLKGVPWNKFDFWGLEYRYVSRYLQGKISYSHMYEELKTKIHQYAKRQETWFRRMEKKGLKINWIDGDDFSLLKNKLIGAIDEIPCKF